MTYTQKLIEVEKLKDYLKSCSTECTDIYEVLTTSARDISSSERASIYFYNKENNSLETYIAQGLSIKIQVHANESLAGLCATSKKPVLENDVDVSSHFNSSVDLENGFVTINTLCIPILDFHDNILGVLQVLNKLPDGYSETDEEIIVDIANSVAEFIARTSK
ncbi:MAG: GAF domain-containing protein [Helicobacteraceae bacterium]|nr:GAF domain-containing protein [Helicobacteraceae bacterium]